VTPVLDERRPDAQPPKHIAALASFAGGWGLQLVAIAIGIAIGLATGQALVGAVAGVILAVLLMQVVLPLAFRRSGWGWGVTRRRRGRR
jgi:hypothetical protein